MTPRLALLEAHPAATAAGKHEENGGADKIQGYSTLHAVRMRGFR
jgi:hypothetical protein